ncbi:MAG: ECF transporter S component [Clostridia bacterium]|nr:ECF transporter S component [Clostridia bacterium]
MNRKNTTLKLILSAMFLALAFVLPFLTGQVPQVGAMLLPMHIPVILCGFICGAPWGLVVGATAPLLRSLILGMPPLFPTAISMAFELAAYGFLAGLLYRVLPKKKINIYTSLLISMISGRIVWGIVQFCLLGFDVEKFPLSAFFAGAVVNAIPGIILQILLIPVILLILEKSKISKKITD